MKMSVLRINLVIFVVLATVGLAMGLMLLDQDHADALISGYFLLLGTCVRSISDSDSDSDVKEIL